MAFLCIFVVHAWSWATSDNLILLEVERFRGKKDGIVVQWPLQEQRYQQLFNFAAEDRYTPAHTLGCATLFV